MHFTAKQGSRPGEQNRETEWGIALEGMIFRRVETGGVMLGKGLKGDAQMEKHCHGSNC